MTYDSNRQGLLANRPDAVIGFKADTPSCRMTKGTTMSNNKSRMCGHTGCSCEIDEDCHVNRDGYCYCSEACADGQGCEHEHCDCSTKAANQSPADDESNKGPEDFTHGAHAINPTKPVPKKNPGHNVAFNPAQGGPSIRSNPEAGKRR